MRTWDYIPPSLWASSWTGPCETPLRGRSSSGGPWKEGWGLLSRNGTALSATIRFCLNQKSPKGCRDCLKNHLGQTPESHPDQEQAGACMNSLNIRLFFALMSHRAKQVGGVDERAAKRGACRQVTAATGFFVMVGPPVVHRFLWGRRPRSKCLDTRSLRKSIRNLIPALR